jgi:hypothetical protein
MFPLKKYKHRLPSPFETAAGFGYSQKNGKHQSGIELYCDEGQEVFAIEESDIIDMFLSTGYGAETPWFQNTYTLLLEGNSGVINYSCILIDHDVKFGKTIKEGQLIGRIKKLMDISIPSLYIGLYYNGVEEPIEWNRGEVKPTELLDPTDMLKFELQKTIFRY